MKTTNRTGRPERPATATQRAIAAALLLLAPAIWLPVPPVGAVATASCVNYEDDAGFGGSDVECPLPCGRHAGLAVLGHAQDSDAWISAAYNCGGQSAGCSLAAPTCADTSKGLTDRADQDGLCEAESDEFWSSTVFVACATLSVLPGSERDPLEIVCQAINRTIDPCKDGVSLREVTDYCALQAGSEEEAEATRRHFAMAAPGLGALRLLSLRTILLEEDGRAESLLFVGDADSANWECSVQEFRWQQDYET